MLLTFLNRQTMNEADCRTRSIEAEEHTLVMN